MSRIFAVRQLDVTRCGASRTQEMLDQCRQRLGMEPLNITAGNATGY